MQDFETKYNELLNAVSDMRVKQKDYYGCKTSVNLTMAKHAERKIDKMIEAEQAKLIKLQQVLNFK